MTLVEALAVGTRLAFVFLAALTLVDVFRQRDLARLEIFLVFATIGVSYSAALLSTFASLSLPLWTTLGNLAILAHPFLVLRVSMHFRIVPRWLLWFAGVCLIASWLLELVIPAPIPIPLALFVVAQFCAVELYAAYAFFRGALTTRGVTHNRLQMVSVGTGLLALIVALLAPMAVLREVSPALFDFAVAGLYLVAIASGVSYYLGFAPPRPLRRAWQLSELYVYLRDVSAQAGNSSTDDTLRQLCGVATRAIGGTAAAVALWDEPAQKLVVRVATPENKLWTEALADTSGGLGRAWRARPSAAVNDRQGLNAAEKRLALALNAHALLAVPLASGQRTWGLLSVWLPRSPLFAADDRALLSLFAEHTARALASAELLRAERQLSEQLAKQRVELETANAALRRSEEIFSKIFHANPAAICITRQPDGLFMDANPAFLRLTGYSEADLQQQTTVNLQLYTNPGDRVAIGKVMQTEGSLHNYEMDARVKSGAILRVLLSMESITLSDTRCTLSIIYDITAQQQAQAALRRSEAVFSSVFRASPIAISLTQKDGGQFVDVNDSHVQLMGYPRAEIIGRTVGELGIYARPADRAAMLARLQEGQAIRNLELDLRTKSGAIIHGLVSLESIALDGVPCVLGITIDITERREAEEAIRRLNADLHQRTTQLEAANQELHSFSYSVSHDLRAPLRGIDGFSLALLEDYDARLDDTGRDYLRRLRAGVQRMAELIDAMLTLSRVSQGEFRRAPVDLSALSRSLLADLQRREPEREVQTAVADGLVALGDLRLLQTALANLMDNAWKYTGKTPSACIQFGSAPVNGESAYYIRDNGAGFDMAYADKLFGAFQRLHRQSEFPGTGIGLATVQRIVRRHGGRIWAESAVGQGTTIYFTLDGGAGH